jgi:hypothetical protein
VISELIDASIGNSFQLAEDYFCLSADRYYVLCSTESYKPTVLLGCITGQFIMYSCFIGYSILRTPNASLSQHTLAKSHLLKIYVHVPLAPHVPRQVS